PAGSADYFLDNQGAAVHNLTIEEEGVSVDVQPGLTSTITLDVVPGTFAMYCSYHRDQGMTGTVQVLSV
ncbi:MAG: cupredoxin domain-containing protein, partial [Actinomycetota bacterium]|nr:cupredoxin domain-containing protein [Actinomycetota bacterium]